MVVRVTWTWWTYMHLTLDDIVREILFVFSETIMPLCKRLLAVCLVNDGTRDTHTDKDEGVERDGTYLDQTGEHLVRNRDTSDHFNPLVRSPHIPMQK
jgi:hypothetical protein